MHWNKCSLVILYDNQISLYATRKAQDLLILSFCCHTICHLKYRGEQSLPLISKALKFNAQYPWHECGSEGEEAEADEKKDRWVYYWMFSVCGPAHISLYFQVHWTERVIPASGSGPALLRSSVGSGVRPTSERSITRRWAGRRGARAPGWQVQPFKNPLFNQYNFNASWEVKQKKMVEEIKLEIKRGFWTGAISKTSKRVWFLLKFKQFWTCCISIYFTGFACISV